jgi:hypothetical protein
VIAEERLVGGSFSALALLGATEVERSETLGEVPTQSSPSPSPLGERVGVTGFSLQNKIPDEFEM